ncbi:AAA-like domain-containing protein [Leptothoe kymatousa]|uniref:AAA-like domain-containing protein n=1 Tax=Leptothoe kymatousa TAU-MAC 1615 TaxID=2364775 RepID=A0ABS5Y5B7_9CYAN|nr:AAA-like domain-containing protein [Leptothoe kymatousa]MBT9312554.1 AAA-like domain-containing protein [Leptothoe kymatousa TAU-MAC 1615]
MSDLRKILLLSANPTGTAKVRLDEEMREIEEGLLRAKQRSQFTIETATALRYRDLRRSILRHDPHIVHFSGHGVGEEGLVFEDETGHAKLVNGEALSGLFELVADQVECVLLNACYSQEQAEAIAQHIPYVIGMTNAIGDRSAIEFAVGFYDALGAGKRYEEAYKFGRNAIQLAGIPEEHTPIWLGPSTATDDPTSGQRVFIRYRNQKPEVTLAQAFHDHLKAAGHTPVLAAEGLQRVTQIDQELRHCDYLLLLLSETSASSDRVAGEVQTARQLWKPHRKPIILPIRVNLPKDYPLHAELWRALQAIPQSNWQSPADTPRLVQDLAEVITEGKVPEPIEAEPVDEAKPSDDGPPHPVADLELPGGTMLLDSKFYIRREPWDTRCLQEIENRAGLVRIKAPRQMGKTSLLARIRDRAVQLGYRPVAISFLETDERAFADASVFLKRFCASVSKQLGLSPKRVKDCWDEDLFGPKENCSDYFEEELLSTLDTPLFLGLDELDRLFPYETVSKEFLTLLRSWNEKAKVNDTWAKLRMAIAHSTESYVVLDTNSSPFNVGLAVELPEFSVAQVLELMDKHGLSWGTGDVEALMDMVGGHPYLVRLALYHLAQQDMTLPKLLTDAPTDGGIYSEHLRRHLWNLQQHPDLATAFEQVIMTDRPVELRPILGFKLNGMGLVTLQGNDVVLRHERLYRPYFRSRLRSLA